MIFFKLRWDTIGVCVRNDLGREFAQSDPGTYLYVSQSCPMYLTYDIIILVACILVFYSLTKVSRKS